MTILAKNVTVRGSDNMAEIYMDVGGNNMLCPLCNGRGLYIYVKADETSFHYNLATLLLEPKENLLLVHIPYNIRNGGVIGIKNKNKLYLQIRMLTNLFSAIDTFTIRINNTLYQTDAKIISYHSGRLTNSIEALLKVF